MLRLLVKYINWLNEHGKEALPLIVVDLLIKMWIRIYLIANALGKFMYCNRRDIGVNVIAGLIAGVIAGVISGLIVWKLTTAS